MLRLLTLFAAQRLAHQGWARALLSTCGIALGVALGYGVHLVNRAAVEDLAASVRELSGGADLEVRGGRSGFPEKLYAEVARLPGVASVAPALELEVGLAGTQRTVRVLGVDLLREPALVADPALRAEAWKGDTAVVSEGLEQKPISLVVGAGKVDLKVAGSVPLKGQAVLVD